MTHKYRGLTEECRWAYGHYCKVEGKHYIILDDAELFPSNFDDPIYLNGEVIYGFIRVFPKTVGQYIGIKDRKRTKEFPKGQDICGGDIVSAGIYYDEGPRILEIYYDRGGYWIDYKGEGYDRVLVGEFMGSLEIIGNIHQNPELKEN